MRTVDEEEEGTLLGLEVGAAAPGRDLDVELLAGCVHLDELALDGVAVMKPDVVNYAGSDAGVDVGGRVGSPAARLAAAHGDSGVVD